MRAYGEMDTGKFCPKGTRQCGPDSSDSRKNTCRTLKRAARRQGKIEIREALES